MILRPVAPPVEYGITKRLARAGNAAIAFLRTLGTSAHVWLPGANGVSVASLPRNNYLLSDGRTGYSTVDGVDGLTLDGMGSLGAEKVINGSAFVDKTGWIVGSGGSGGAISVAAGELVCTATAGGFITSTPFTTVIGNTYKMVGTGRKGTYTGSPQFGFSATVTGIPSPMVTFTTTSNETKELYFVATATTSYAIIRFPTIENGATAYFDNISVKEYTGTHISQATTANKPILRRGLVNLLPYSNDFSQWSKSACTVTATGVADPWGGTLASTVTSSGSAELYKQISTSGVKTSGIWIRRRTGTGNISIRNTANTAWIALTVTSTWALFVNDGGTVGASGWCDIQFPTSGDAIDVCFGGVFEGTWTAAQILAEGGIPTTTATAASNPSAGKYWWSFDGSNDSLLSGNLGITTACTIVIAGRVNSLATVQTLLAEDANGVQIYIDTSGIVTLVKFGVSLIVNTAAATIVAGVPFVVTVRLSGGTAVIRKNGVQVATAATALAFSATTGARIGTNFDGTTQPAGGALGWVVPLPVALSDADCLTVERLVAAQFPGLTTPDGDALALLLEDGSGFLTMETGDLLLLE